MTIMSMAPSMNAVFYYSFHFLYLGHPSDILARLWLAEDISNVNNSTTNGAEDSENSLLSDIRSAQVWKAFDDSMRESYKATGIIVCIHTHVVAFQGTGILAGRSRCSSDIWPLFHRCIQISRSRSNGPSHQSHFQRLQRLSVSLPSFNSVHEPTQHPAQLGILRDRVHHHSLRSIGMAQSGIMDSAGSHSGDCVDWRGGFGQGHCDDGDWDNVRVESRNAHLYASR
jgi:hypothetical protein